MMDLNKLQAMWQEFFAYQIKQLVETGDIIPTFLVVSGRNDKPDAVIAVEGDVMNSSSAKSRLGQTIRTVIAEIEGQAVMSTVDVWIATFEDEKQGEMLYRSGLSVTQGEALGLCRKREALVASIESPILVAMEQQLYRREGDKVVLEDRIPSPDNLTVTGRLGGFFKEQTVGRA